MEQLELLAERSKSAKAETLPELTAQMINLVRILEFESLSAGGTYSNLHFAVQLSESRLGSVG